VASSRQPERLSAMNPFERKVVHDVIATVAGVHSESEGEEPNRRVVILPDS
jgi:spoIIIJ-associated protein